MADGRVEVRSDTRCSRFSSSDTRNLRMTREQKSLLDRRFREAVKQQPDIILLRRLLLVLGGVHLVAPPWLDTTMPLVINAGFVMAGPVARRAMEKSDCHRNVAEIWTSREREIVGIGTGYSLSDDGLWRQHTWGVQREGIVETTVPRVKYFGVLLQGRDADLFAIANWAAGMSPGGGRREKGTGTPRGAR